MPTMTTPAAAPTSPSHTSTSSVPNPNPSLQDLADQAPPPFAIQKTPSGRTLIRQYTAGIKGDPPTSPAKAMHREEGTGRQSTSIFQVFICFAFCVCDFLVSSFFPSSSSSFLHFFRYPFKRNTAQKIFFDDNIERDRSHIVDVRDAVSFEPLLFSKTNCRFLRFVLFLSYLLILNFYLFLLRYTNPLPRNLGFFLSISSLIKARRALPSHH